MTFPTRYAEHIGQHDVIVLDNLECIVINAHPAAKNTVYLEVWPTNGDPFFPVTIPRKAKVPLVHLYDEY